MFSKSTRCLCRGPFHSHFKRYKWTQHMLLAELEGLRGRKAVQSATADLELCISHERFDLATALVQFLMKCKQCSIEHLGVMLKLSCKHGDWQAVAGWCSVLWESDLQITATLCRHVVHRLGEAKQWQQITDIVANLQRRNSPKEVLEATYCELLNALLKAGNAEHAEAIMSVVRARQFNVDFNWLQLLEYYTTQQPKKAKALLYRAKEQAMQPNPTELHYLRLTRALMLVADKEGVASLWEESYLPSTPTVLCRVVDALGRLGRWQQLQKLETDLQSTDANIEVFVELLYAYSRLLLPSHSTRETDMTARKEQFTLYASATLTRLLQAGFDFRSHSLPMKGVRDLLPKFKQQYRKIQAENAFANMLSVEPLLQILEQQRQKQADPLVLDKILASTQPPSVDEHEPIMVDEITTHTAEPDKSEEHTETVYPIQLPRLSDLGGALPSVMWGVQLLPNTQ
eukprot:TRINITY_DN74734_c0_g1_i1.p1 TRINITY_DN74734_c0_g1~~TRINITY_DN74734_c0_g1_i1.p1  ORF type:complete len:458 (-),score=28.19 TRINITY_DN74734_c0_g1_i1:147-1520(-)